MAQILVHEKALGHLTRGLYRSPASAVRELVSNAWDANATEVAISTSRPSFHRLSVTDNGDGFSRDNFARLMEGFGNSDKRTSSASLKYGRKLIGRLGIGMLGIAQVCGSFVIRSRPRKGVGFAASVRLSERLRERMDTDDGGETGNPVMPPVALPDDHRIMVGEYDFIDDDTWKELRIGTVIETDDLIPTFSHAFRTTYTQISVPPLSAKDADKTKSRAPLPIPTTWAAFLRRVGHSATVQELGDYWRFAWDLAALCPLPYTGKTALPRRVVASQQERLLKHRFEVLLDDVALRKPIELHDNPGGYTAKLIRTTKKHVFQRELSFSGYIVVQEGRQLRPSEVRGILVRIRDVGVGLYDPSMLDYRINEGPRSRWLTGEIFVEEGLEDALNIDRDSFNRYSPEFQVLQREIHAVLQKDVFPDVYRQIDKRAKTHQKQRARSRVTSFKDALTRLFPDRAVVVRLKSTSGETDDQIAVSMKARRLMVDLPREGLTGTAKPYRTLAASVIAIYDIAQEEPDAKRRRSRFLMLLRDLLRTW